MAFTMFIHSQIGPGRHVMNTYTDGCARVTDECLQIHHMPCDVFDNSMNQHQLFEEELKIK